jgi:D-aminopeptidase
MWSRQRKCMLPGMGASRADRRAVQAPGTPLTSTPDLLFRMSSGRFPTGPTNSISDAGPIRVGHTTLDDGESTFSGATAIVIDGVTPANPARAGMFVGNGHGKFVGATQVVELGKVETPIILTSTLSSFRAADAVVTWALGELTPRPVSINPIVGEINDSWLSSRNPRPVTAEAVLSAIADAATGPFLRGSVGGGTGACALGFKGGIGTASRRVAAITVGVIVQANMSGQLRLDGRTILPADLGTPIAGPETEYGSCVIVIAVDAPFEANLLRRIASRAVFALARVGARFSTGSGDYAIAVSTQPGSLIQEPTDAVVNAVFEATMDAVEDAVLDALMSATTKRSSNGRIAFSLQDAIAAMSSSHA